MNGSNFNADLLQVARLAASMNQTELSRRIGVGQNTLSRWESGIREPSEDEIEKIAEALGRPVGFFYRTERPLSVDAGFMFHRKRAKTKQSTLQSLHAKLNITRLSIASLVKQLADWDVRFYRMPIEEFSSAAEVARLLRTSWQVNKGPIRNLVEMVEAAGAIVVTFDFGTRDIDAVGWWPWDTPPLMFLNSSAPADRVRFSLAHELGHLVMHEVPSETMEPEADLFASEFLVPEASARTELRDITPTKLWQLKHRWRVSGQCLVRRASDAGTIDERRYKSLMCYFSKKGWRKAEPYPIDPESSSTLKRIMQAFTTDLGYSQIELRALMGVTDDELASLFNVVPPKPALRLVTNDLKRKPR